MTTLAFISLFVMLLILIVLLINLVIFLVPGLTFVVALALLIGHVAQAMKAVTDGWPVVADNGWWHCAMQWMNEVPF
ncbi:MAG: hypothetical protein HYV02_08075 [Deltaproteobacteria bacterium]|nr:hypothetical protein [Deltaproteobacteria bacterium]